MDARDSVCGIERVAKQNIFSHIASFKRNHKEKFNSSHNTVSHQWRIQINSWAISYSYL